MHYWFDASLIKKSWPVSKVDGSNEINATDETTSNYDADLEEEIIEQSGVTTIEYTIGSSENADSKDTLGIGSYYYFHTYLGN